MDRLSNNPSLKDMLIVVIYPYDVIKNRTDEWCQNMPKYRLTRRDLQRLPTLHKNHMLLPLQEAAWISRPSDLTKINNGIIIETGRTEFIINGKICRFVDKGKSKQHDEDYESYSQKSKELTEKNHKQFIQEKLFYSDQVATNKHYADLKKYYQQSLNNDFFEELFNRFKDEYPKIKTQSQLLNIIYEADDNVYIEVNTLLEEMVGVNVETKQLPGMLSTRYKLTPQGFEVEWVETSNALLHELIFGEKYKVTDDDIQQAFDDEHTALLSVIKKIKDSELKKSADNINQTLITIDEKERLKSQIIILTRQIIEDPFNRTRLFAYKKLYKSAIKNDALKDTTDNMNNMINYLEPFHQQREALENTLRQCNHPNIKKHGLNVLHQVEKTSPLHSDITVRELTNVLKETDDVINNKMTIQTYQKHAYDIAPRSTGKIIASAMLCLAGALVIAASAVAAMIGVLPATVVGMVVGGGMAKLGAYSLFNSVKKKDARDAMESLAKTKLKTTRSAK